MVHHNARTQQLTDKSAGEDMKKWTEAQLKQMPILSSRDCLIGRQSVCARCLARSIQNQCYIKYTKAHRQNTCIFHHENGQCLK